MKPLKLLSKTALTTSLTPPQVVSSLPKVMANLNTNSSSSSSNISSNSISSLSSNNNSRVKCILRSRCARPLEVALQLLLVKFAAYQTAPLMFSLS